MLNRKSKICRQFAALLMAAALTTSMGCATLSADATNEQRFFEAKAQWNTVMAAAVAFAVSPTGQANPEVLRKIQAVGYRVQGALIELDISMCYIGPPTENDSAPPPADTCVPLGEGAAAKRFDFVARVLLVAISEVQALLAEEISS
jgi:hypothetical protein